MLHAWSMQEQEVLSEASPSFPGSLLQREKPRPGDRLGGGWEWEEEPGWGGVWGKGSGAAQMSVVRRAGQRSLCVGREGEDQQGKR